MKRIGSILLFLFLGFSVFAQKEKKLIQFSGVVLSADTLDAIPYVSIYDKTIKRATFADYTGFYSMVVQAGDTMMFQSVGFKKTLYIIPDTLTQSRYTMVQLLKPDTIYLKEVSVRPWPSREEFAQAFMDLDLPQTAFDRYSENMTLAELKAANTDFGDALSCYDAQMSTEYSRLYSQGQVPTLNLLSPTAWRNFIKTWKAGGFKNKKNK